MSTNAEDIDLTLKLSAEYIKNLEYEISSLKKNIQTLDEDLKCNKKELEILPMKLFFKRYIRTRFHDDMKLFFSHWKKVTAESKQHLEGGRELLKNKVKDQKLTSEQELIISSQNQISVLKNSLLCTIYFYKWKLKINNIVMGQERQKWDKEKKQIFKEIKNVKSLVDIANKEERKLFKASNSKGENVIDSLVSYGEISYDK